MCWHSAIWIFCSAARKTRDPICGYVGVIGEVCPRCGRREGEALSKERIDELRKQYPEITTFCGCE